MAVQQRQLDIFESGRAGQQIEVLKDEPDLVIANVRQLIAIERGNIGFIKHVSAGCRPIETTENIHECRFAGTARAHQRDKFAALDFERDAAHRVHFHLAGAVRLVDIAQPDDRAVVHVDLNSGSWKATRSAEWIRRRRR